MHAQPLERRILCAVSADPTIPVLNSNPGAPVTLFLDFHGEPAEQWGGRTVPAVPAYDVNQVAPAFEVVANAYAPFNVNVTTVDPGGWDPGGQLPHNHRFRVVVGGDGSWSGAVQGGCAMVGSMDASWEPNTAFVFSDLFPNGADVGLECVHEAGHGFGLQHQSVWTNGVKTQEYAPGFYMGTPFSGTLVGWGDGINSLGQPQDDVAILTAELGTNPHYKPGDVILLPGTGGGGGSATPVTLPPDDVNFPEFPRNHGKFREIRKKSYDFDQNCTFCVDSHVTPVRVTRRGVEQLGSSSGS